MFKFRTVGNLTRQASRLTRHYEQEQQYGEEHDGFEDDEFYRGANTSGPNSRVPSQHASNHNSQYGNGSSNGKLISHGLFLINNDKSKLMCFQYLKKF